LHIARCIPGGALILPEPSGSDTLFSLSSWHTTCTAHFGDADLQNHTALFCRLKKAKTFYKRSRSSSGFWMRLDYYSKTAVVIPKTTLEEEAITFVRVKTGKECLNAG
jgi:hypothetical protein